MSITEPRRVTREQVHAEILSEHTFTAAEGQAGASSVLCKGVVPESLHRLTICVLVLRNGAQVVGVNYGAIDLTTHSPEMGRAQAQEAALEKVRDYLGFRLRDQIAAETPAQPAAKRYTRFDVHSHIVQDDVPGWRVRVYLRLNDGKEIHHDVGFLELAGLKDMNEWERHEYALKRALAVANGEAP